MKKENKLLQQIKRNDEKFDKYFQRFYGYGRGEGGIVSDTENTFSDLEDVKSHIAQSRISELEALEAMLEKQLVEPDITNSGANSPKVWMFEGYVACKKEAIKIIRDTIKELKRVYK